MATPAMTPVTGPTGEVLVPSAPILSFVKTSPVGLLPAETPASTAVAVSLMATGTSSMMAIARTFPAVVVLAPAPSISETANESATADAELGAVFKT